MGEFQLSDMAVSVNDEIVTIEPGTLNFDEGFGEANVRAGSVGNGAVELIFSRDVASKKSTISFEVPSTDKNIELVRGWQTSLGGNVVGLSGSNGKTKVTRTMTQATVVNNPKVNISPDGTIEVEFCGNSVV